MKVRTNFYFIVFFLLPIALLCCHFPYLKSPEGIEFGNSMGLIQELLDKMGWENQAVVIGLGDFLYGNTEMTSDFAFHLSTEIEQAIMEMPQVTLVNRSKLSDILNELGLQQSSVVDPKTANSIGKIRGLDAILMARYSIWQNKVRIVANLIRVEDAKTVTAERFLDRIPTDIAVRPQQQELKRNNYPETKTGNDGAFMVLIPAGEFDMGIGHDYEEEILHRVYLDAFYIDAYEVTNAQYEKFMKATGHRPPGFWSSLKFNAPDKPVVGVSWEDVQVYCRWAGKRLPTEAEWEKAARGGLVGKKYPWGHGITHNDANYDGIEGKDKWEGTSPVGSFATNGYGLYDMVGNVFEWCSDYYNESYYEVSPRENPRGPNYGETRVVRGGSWKCSDIYDLYVSTRNYCEESEISNDGGFRCVQDVGIDD